MDKIRLVFPKHVWWMEISTGSRSLTTQSSIALSSRFSPGKPARWDDGASVPWMFLAGQFGDMQLKRLYSSSRD